MIISEISIKNFKSYGNSVQKLELNTNNGELILLMGSNGAGKSTLISSFDFSLFGKCKGGVRKKWSTLSTLPNRINSGDMLIDIKFQSNGIDVGIKRGIAPNILELSENGVVNEQAGKANIDERIERYVGMDLDSFKSFISMSVDSFKNFMSLSSEEKQMLLDKLFNLEVVNILNGILKDINKSNKLRMTSLDSEIRTLEDSINSIQRSIDNVIEKEKENIQQEIDILVQDMNSKKDEYKILKEKVDKIKEKEQQLSSELEIEKKQYINTQNDVKNVQKEINLYDSGKCPTCSTDFTSEHFVSLRSSLIEKKEGYDNILSEIERNTSLVKEKQLKLKTLAEKTTTSFNDMNYLLRNYKSKIDELTKKKTKESNGNSINIQEFKKTIIELNDKKVVSHESITMSKEKELYYKELNRIFGEDGVKKAIITGIIKPINHFISENIAQMGLPFEVRLDETFTAEIKHLGSPIEHDTLSTGERRKCNVAILIAYLKLIRIKKQVNILFLDEVFSSIDINGIEDILKLLKLFANEYNINIFVVHHALLSEEMFDRIIKVDKNIFSSIEELDLSNNNMKYGN